MNNGLPAAQVASTYSRWKRVGVMSTTASTSGFVDHLVTVGAAVLDIADDGHEAIDAARVGIGRRDAAHEAVVGEEPDRDGVRLRDRAAADHAEPQRLAHGSYTTGRKFVTSTGG